MVFKVSCHQSIVSKLKKESFQMTIESNYKIAIARLSDWLKRLAPVFQTMRSKIKTNVILYAHARFFPRLEQVAGNCHEF